MESTKYETPKSLHLDVRIPAGTVTVKTQEIATTTLELSGDYNPDEISIDFAPDGDGHRLTVEQRKRGLFGSLKSKNLQIHVVGPTGMHVSLNGGSTDLKARGQLGSLVFHTGSGDATVESVDGNATAKVASGDLKVDHVGGQLSFHSASGDVKAREVLGGTTARTASGDVKLDTVGGSVKATTVSGSITIEQLLPGATTNAQAVSGDIEIGVRAGTGVYLDLSAVSGSTTSDLAASDGPASGTESGLAEIKASTVSGDVKVRHSRV
jgi:DUF4097 and DUF4098 domain-containing protein YvlB